MEEVLEVLLAQVVTKVDTTISRNSTIRTIRRATGVMVVTMEVMISRNSTIRTIRRATEVMVVIMEVMTSKIFVLVIFVEAFRKP
jgi:hypothetical protein